MGTPSDIEDMHWGVAIATRHGVMKKHNVGTRKATKPYFEIVLVRSEGDIRIASVYIPPETSRCYDDGNLEMLFEWVQELGIMAGDMNWRASRSGWAGLLQESRPACRLRGNARRRGADSTFCAQDERPPRARAMACASSGARVRGSWSPMSWPQKSG